MKFFSSISRKLKIKLPAQNVVLLPGECFFCRAVPLPDGVPTDDIAQFAEFSMENQSPFLLDQLSWGYVFNAEFRRIFIYGAYSDRIRRLGFTDLEVNYQVFPSFLARFGQTFPEKTVSFLVSNESISALFYEPGNPVPLEVVSRSYPEENNPVMDWFEARDDLLKSLDTTGFTLDTALFRVESGYVDHKGEIGSRIRVLTVDGGEGKVKKHRIALSPEDIWPADVRRSAFKSRELKHRTLAQKVWRAVSIGGVAAALLFALQVVVFSGKMWLSFQESKIEKRQTQVDLIEQKNEFLEKINQFTNLELRPFEMLDALNRKRPDTVYFTKAHSDTFNHISIDGQADSVAEFNRYTDVLSLVPEIENIDVDRITSRVGKAPFIFSVSFKETGFIFEEEDMDGDEPELPLPENEKGEGE